MIIARLQGGLGNQLFQYATGRALADAVGQELGLDIREMSQVEPGNTPRPYLLDRYKLRASLVPAWRLNLLGYPRSARLRRALHRLGLNRGRCLREAGPAYQLLNPGRGANYLDGYWQSWRYFQAERPALLKDLSLQRLPNAANAALLKRIQRGPSVCLHVRRGDYVTLAAASAFHGLMGLNYYRAALKKMGSAARDATLYVFTDEPAWARANMKLGVRRVVVDQNSVDEPQEDLRLMAACRHFILANSSLSWWGAWLSQSKTKKVVAPKRWYKAGPPTPDLCPRDWIRL